MKMRHWVVARASCPPRARFAVANPCVPRPSWPWEACPRARRPWHTRPGRPCYAIYIADIITIPVSPDFCVAATCRQAGTTLRSSGAAPLRSTSAAPLRSTRGVGTLSQAFRRLFEAGLPETVFRRLAWLTSGCHPTALRALPDCEQACNRGSRYRLS